LNEGFCFSLEENDGNGLCMNKLSSEFFGDMIRVRSVLEAKKMLAWESKFPSSLEQKNRITISEFLFF
jgi:hypothetical protein